MALKSRVLLYAASDLHNTSVFASFSNPELLGYTGGDRTARWTAAKNAAKDVINLGLYGLVNSDPAPGDSIAQNYQSQPKRPSQSNRLIHQFFSRLPVCNVFLKYQLYLPV